MIEIKGLYKRYHNHHSNEWVLRDINITIPTGVSVGLIGANGAGKSTLLRLIAGMDTPDKGEVIRHSRVSWPVGLTGGMQGSLTGRQNVKFVARAQGRRKEVDRIVSFVEDFAEIGRAFDDPVKTYSSGMRSRLSFGLSLAFDFDVFISDEATSVGDIKFKQKAQDVFKSKVSTSSLIIVSHGEAILRELCSAGIYVKDGYAIWYDNIDDALSAYHDDINSNNYISKKKSNAKGKKEIPIVQRNRQISKRNLVAIKSIIKSSKIQLLDSDSYDLIKDLEQYWTRKSYEDEKLFSQSQVGIEFYKTQELNKLKNLTLCLDQSKEIIHSVSPKKSEEDIDKVKQALNLT